MNTEESLKVLVAEDERISRLFLSRLLQRAGYRVVEVENGEEVLPALRSEGADLLLLDYNLPGLSGAELAFELQGDANHGTIPVLIITGYAEDEVQELELPANVKAVVTKPVDQKKLLQLIKEFGAHTR
jgi:CheY-like chemotaxis protein